ncbi:MAG: hypothetical protein JWO06_2664 [Bacteroidota bacterium]|nr:hypothetical protein [Bacteroidota bacterium]
MFKNTFLYRLFSADKLLFGIIIVYALGVMYYSFRQREEFPFLLYGMYSLKEPAQQTYTTYSIVLDSQEIRYSKLRDAQRELINSTLTQAIPMMESGKMSREDSAAFKTWLMNYTADMRMVGDNKMHVYRLTCNYNQQGHVSVLKKEEVYTYGEEE